MKAFRHAFAPSVTRICDQLFDYVLFNSKPNTGKLIFSNNFKTLEMTENSGLVFEEPLLIFLSLPIKDYQLSNPKCYIIALIYYIIHT
jgi:hypothetical protein